MKVIHSPYDVKIKTLYGPVVIFGFPHVSVKKSQPMAPFIVSLSMEKYANVNVKKWLISDPVGRFSNFQSLESLKLNFRGGR